MQKAVRVADIPQTGLLFPRTCRKGSITRCSHAAGDLWNIRQHLLTLRLAGNRGVDISWG